MLRRIGGSSCGAVCRVRLDSVLHLSAGAASMQSAVRCSSSGAPQTYYDYMSMVWNGSKGPVTDSTTVVEGGGGGGSSFDFGDVFCGIRDALGIETWAALVCMGGLVRFATLYFSLYGERAAARMQCALPTLQPAHAQFQRVFYNDNASSLDVQQAATVLKSIRKQTYKKHHTSNAKTLMGLVGSPMVLQGFYTASWLCESIQHDVGTSSFLWCTALGMPDPLFILPILSCSLTLLNLELTLSSRDSLKQGMLGNVIWGMRALCLCAIPAVAQFRSGVLLYWIGMSTVGLLQPLLVRSAVFKQWFGIPDAPQPSAVEGDLLQRRMTLQAPYLAYLFEAEGVDHVSKAVPHKEPPAKPVARWGSILDRLASGTHPTNRSTTTSAVPSQQKTSGATLSEEMRNIEAQAFRNRRAAAANASAQPSTSAVKTNGAAFAAGGTSWRTSNDACLAEDDLLPAEFKKKK